MSADCSEYLCSGCSPAQARAGQNLSHDCIILLSSIGICDRGGVYLSKSKFCPNIRLTSGGVW